MDNNNEGRILSDEIGKPKRRWDLIIFLPVFSIIVIGSAFAYRSKIDSYFTTQIQVAIPTDEQLARASLIPVLKTYSNLEYRFKVSYPLRGIIFTEDNLAEGICGQVIKEGESQNGHVIELDNIIKVEIINWKGTIDEYLASKWARNKYNLLPITGTGADEAIEVLGLKKEAESAVNYSPLANIDQIYKKGSLLYKISLILIPKNQGGCINPAALDSAKYGYFKKQKWDLKKNIKFMTV